MVNNILMYFNEYEIDNIPRENNRYMDVMESATSLAPIQIEYEVTIIKITNLGKPSHDYLVEDFIKDSCFANECISISPWYEYIYTCLKNGIFPSYSSINVGMRIKKIGTLMSLNFGLINEY